MPEQSSDRHNATPGRVLRSLQETARADLPELSNSRPRPANPLAVDLLAETSATAHGAPDGEPTLEIHRDGEHIHRITANCACGRTIDIHCDYLSAGDASPPGENPS